MWPAPLPRLARSDDLEVRMPVDPPLLAALEPSERAQLLSRAVARTLAPGQSLYLAGGSAGRAHLLLEGIAKLMARNGEGHATILCLALPGELVGEIGLFDEGPQPLDVVAATPARVLGLDSAALHATLRRNPRAALEAAGAIARRLRWICDASLERSAGTVPARLAGRLLELADLLGRMRGGTIEVEIPLAQEDLGRLAGMCRESACKALRGFKRQGVLDYSGRHLRILRPDVLETIRCEGRLPTTRDAGVATSRR